MACMLMHWAMGYDSMEQVAADGWRLTMHQGLLTCVAVTGILQQQQQHCFCDRMRQ